MGSLVDDVELRLTAGKPSDDFEVERSQIRAWVDDAYAPMASKFVGEVMFGRVPGSMRREYECLPVLAKGSDCLPNCGQKVQYYVTLPVDVLNLPNEGGVYAVYVGDRLVERFGSGMDVRRLRDFKFALVGDGWVRTGDRVYLVGSLYPAFVRVAMELVLGSTEGVGDDEVFPGPAELIAAVKMEAYKVGMMELKGVVDVSNDGG